MKFKKVLSILLALCLSLGIVACEVDSESGSGSESGQAESSQAGGSEGPYTVGFVVSTQTNPFFVTLTEALEAKAEELGIEVVTVDAQDDPAQATSGVDDLITRQVDLIIINPTDSDAIVPAVEQANSAGIPVMTVDRMSNGGEVVAHIASDNVAGGQLAGEFIIEQIGDEGKLVELEGVPGANSSIERGEGLDKALEASNIEVVAEQTANFDRTEGLNVMENILQAQAEIDAVFAHNDEMALGALEAIESSGRDILVVGFDATDDAVASVEAGGMAATVAQKPDLMGELAIQIANDYLSGQEVDDFIPVELELIKE